MIQDGEGLRDPQFHGMAEAEDRSSIEGYAAFTRNKPAVVVVIKRRRSAATPPQGDQHAAQATRLPHEERQPRVYQLPTSASTPNEAAPAVTADRDDPVAGELLPNAGIEVSLRRRRARRDPARKPGEVTRTVFEAPVPVPVVQPAEAVARQPEWVTAGYEQVIAGLRQLRAELDLVLSARRFRIE